MGYTMIEKILARASNRASVSPGDIVEAEIDTAMIHDGTGAQTVLAFRELGRESVWDPGKIVIIFDHNVPAPSEKIADIQQLLRRFSREQGIQLLSMEEGICHQIMPEKGWVYPGAVVLGTDSHTCTHGAFGSFATGIGSTEMAAVFATGRLWFKVPETIKFEICGQFSEGVTAKDLILYLCGKLTAEGASYKAIEFTGPAVEQMGISDRMTLSNMTIEMGAKAGLIEPNDKIVNYISSRVGRPWEVVKADPDALYSETFKVDVSALEPQVACPCRVDNVRPIREIAGLPIDQAFLGSCTNGRMEDLGAAAQLLKGRKISPRVRFIVVPASVEVYRGAIKDGTLQILSDAGAIICNPGCGPCFGGHQGLLAPGERCIASSNRNFKGRMGRDAEVYLASPISVAISALTGEITDPRNFKAHVNLF